MLADWGVKIYKLDLLLLCYLNILMQLLRLT